ncbi:transglycosylase SLT domain-containing protein [Mycobacterium sp.]|uniref:transglycosylase SLT domain-containing protein n=1 Tax=Mycobacterium sp. TaxID=1785 RepID=UPI003D6A39B8
MTADPLKAHATELLARGRRLYGGTYQDGGPIQTPRTLGHHTGRLTVASARPGMGPTAPAARQVIAGLRHAAGADTGLATVLAAARADHTRGRGLTQAMLDDANADSMPAAETPVGRREAVQRMITRIRLQRNTLRRSRQHSRLLAHRARRLTYPHHRHVRYDRSFGTGQVKKHIAAALDHLGITDPAARRNWLRGYQTLIARESGGRPAAVASEPAASPSAVQADGYSMGYARGITQTIPETFARYHQPGTSMNIFDPVANICASMNYVMHRYGVSADGVNLVALVQQADVNRPPRGY